MIHFQNISIKLKHQQLLDAAELKIESGAKVVVKGSSGSGKSSLLKSAIGLTPLAEGAVHIDGLRLSPNTASDIRGRIAYIGQEPVLGADTVRNALLLPFKFKAHLNRAPETEQIIDQLKRLHLPAEILDKSCSDISGGEKQRIAIVRALLLEKRIFFADEVTSALDPESREAVMEELFSPEITLLSISHSPEWVDRCDRIVEIRNRKLVEAVP
jgi:putative ABC transport system ATP-binding protein